MPHQIYHHPKWNTRPVARIHHRLDLDEVDLVDDRQESENYVIIGRSPSCLTILAPISRVIAVPPSALPGSSARNLFVGLFPFT